jgi:hypothetical protein
MKGQRQGYSFAEGTLRSDLLEERRAADELRLLVSQQAEAMKRVHDAYHEHHARVGDILPPDDPSHLFSERIAALLPLLTDAWIERDQLRARVEALLRELSIAKDTEIENATLRARVAELEAERERWRRFLALPRPIGGHDMRIGPCACGAWHGPEDNVAGESAPEKGNG